MSADQEAKVAITADGSQAERVWDRYASTVQVVGDRIKGVLSGIASSTASAHTQMRADLERVEGAIGGVHKRFVAFAAVAAGGAVLKSSIDATSAFTKESTALSRALGINGQQATVLNIALGDVYSNSDAMVGAAGKLAKQLRTNEDQLKSLGVSTREANGDFRNMNDLMMDVIKAVNGYAEGTDRTIAMQLAFGKGAEETTNLLKLNADAIEQAKQKQEELGLVVSVDNVEANKRYRAALNDVGDVLLAVRKTVGDAVMPAFTKLGDWFASIGPAAVVVVRGAIGGLVTVFWGLKNAVTIAWEALDGMVFSVAEPLRSLAESLYQLFTGDYKGAVDTLSGTFDRIRDRWQGAWKSMVASSSEARDQIVNLFQQGASAPIAKGDGGKRINDGNLGNKTESRMGVWEAELAELKLQIAEKARAEGTFREMSKEEERAFWQQKQALAGENAKEAVALRTKVAAASLEIDKRAFAATLEGLKQESDALGKNYQGRIELAERAYQLIASKYGDESKEARQAYGEIIAERRKLAEQQRRIEEIEADTRRNAALADIELERVNADARLAQRLITDEQRLQLERQFEERRYQIQLEALQREQQSFDPNLHPEDYAKATAEIERLAKEHQVRMGQITAQQETAKTNPLGSVMQTFEQQLVTMGQRIVQNWRSIGSAVRAAAAQIGQAIITETIIKPLAAKAAAMAREKIFALFKIGTSAAEAGAGAAAAVAPTPFVGPALAMSALATVFGAVMGLGSKLPSFDVGAWNIPRNMRAEVHAGEAILPKPFADDFRAMVAGGGGGGRGDAAAALAELKLMSFPEVMQIHRRDFIKFYNGLRRDNALRVN